MKTVKDIPPHCVDFFSAEILSIYSHQPDKYAVDTDYFTGGVNTAGKHYAAARSTGENIIGIRFGFRTRKDGELAVAVWMPDFEKCSPDEQKKWTGFALDSDSFVAGPDARFEMWFQRYIQGSWGVDNGVVARIKERVRDVNAVTLTTVGKPLFKFELAGLCFPTAQNNHRYHDAHSEAYKLLVDGLDKETLAALADRLGIQLKEKTDQRKALKTLRALLPEKIHDRCFPAFDLLSQNRGLADHQNRPPGKKMDAFEMFNSDMTKLEAAIDVIKSELVVRLKVTLQ